MNRLYLASLLLSFAAAGSPALAETIVIDVDRGALFDGILDGFPGIAALDGEPDLGGNQLGVALKSGVTEERGIAEFPLAAVTTTTPVRIAAATLTFNIDDVLATFGPGTDFSGRAARVLLIHTYAGDGMIALADFKRISGAPHTVTTTDGSDITDASLRQSGPLRFVVDVTADLATAHAAGASHLGVVWRTTDAATGTSLDDLGDGSAGPPGVGGAQLPFLTVTLDVAATPTPVAATRTPTATATATSPAPNCPGDCDDSGDVTVEELVRLINLALDGGPGTVACPAGDADANGAITVDEIVTAVVTALNGCRSVA